MFLGGLDISLRPTSVWYRWFLLNRSSRNVGLTPITLYMTEAVTIEGRWHR